MLKRPFGQLSNCQALHSALKGYVCAALPSLSLSRQQPAFADSCFHGTAAACIRSQLLSWHGSSLHSQSVALAAASLHSQPAASCSSLQAMHTSHKGLRYRCSVSLCNGNSLHPPATASCFLGVITGFGRLANYPLCIPRIVLLFNGLTRHKKNYSTWITYIIKDKLKVKIIH